MGTQSIPTSLGVSDAASISLLGKDVAHELMGHVTFAELSFWLVAQRRPTPDELAVFEAVLVGLVDHGFTPTVIATRVTYYSAPDSLQGALASGLLGGGSRLLGVTEDAGRMLNVAVREHWSAGEWDTDVDELARQIVREHATANRLVPGLGHRQHKEGDPRVPVLLDLSRRHGVSGPHLELLERVSAVSSVVLNRRLPLNAAGVSGAVFADLGLPVGIFRGLSLLARCAGLVGHLAEEQRQPVGGEIYSRIDERVVYEAPHLDADHYP